MAKIEITPLLMIDAYNDFISEGGKIWDGLKRVAEANWWTVIKSAQARAIRSLVVTSSCEGCRRSHVPSVVVDDSTGTPTVKAVKGHHSTDRMGNRSRSNA